MPNPLLTHEIVLSDNVPLNGQYIADVGCGNGWLTRFAAARGAVEVVGIETTPDQVAALTADHDQGNIRFAVGRGEALPLPDDSQDAVIYVNSFHHVPPTNMGAAMAEATRVLRTGGLLYISEPLPEGDHFNLVRTIDDETAMRRAAAGTIISGYPSTLQRLKEFFHDVPMDFASFAAWEDRLVRVNPQRLRAFTRARQQLSERFHRLAEPIPQGYRFRQPTWVTLFRQI